MRRFILAPEVGLGRIATQSSLLFVGRSAYPVWMICYSLLPHRRGTGRDERRPLATVVAVQMILNPKAGAGQDGNRDSVNLHSLLPLPVQGKRKGIKIPN